MTNQLSCGIPLKQCHPVIISNMIEKDDRLPIRTNHDGRMGNEWRRGNSDGLNFLPCRRVPDIKRRSCPDGENANRSRVECSVRSIDATDRFSGVQFYRLDAKMHVADDDSCNVAWFRKRNLMAVSKLSYEFCPGHVPYAGAQPIGPCYQFSVLGIAHLMHRFDTVQIINMPLRERIWQHCQVEPTPPGPIRPILRSLLQCRP